MLKKTFIAVFVLVLVAVFSYGYVTVYTNSYNTVHEDHIEKFRFEYSPQDNIVRITIMGKDYTTMI